MKTEEIVQLAKDGGWTILSATNIKIRAKKENATATIYTYGYGNSCLIVEGKEIREFRQITEGKLSDALGVPKKPVVKKAVNKAATPKKVTTKPKSDVKTKKPTK